MCLNRFESAQMSLCAQGYSVDVSHIRREVFMQRTFFILFCHLLRF